VYQRAAKKIKEEVYIEDSKKIYETIPVFLHKKA